MDYYQEASRREEESDNEDAQISIPEVTQFLEMTISETFFQLH